MNSTLTISKSKQSNLYDEKLLSRVMHYHGFQLTVALRNRLGIDVSKFIREQIAVKGKQKCIRGLGGEEVCKNIHEFIANHAELLYGTFPKQNRVRTGYVSPLPPLELYMHTSPESRRRLFLKRVKEGDVLYGVITSKPARHQLEVHVICSEGNRYMDVSMLNMLGIVVVPETAHTKEPVYIDDIVRCGLYNKLKTPKNRIYFYLALESFQFSNRQKKPCAHLGKIKFEELPPRFRASRMMKDSENLKEAVDNYVNSPDSDVSLIARTFGLEDKPSSLFPSLRQQYPAGFAPALSKIQTNFWSAQLATDGKKHITKDTKIAMECFNMALKFNPSNTEAIYFKGLLIEHDGQEEEAMLLYKRCLAIDPGYVLANETVKRLTMKIQEKEAAKTLSAAGLGKSLIVERAQKTDPRFAKKGTVSSSESARFRKGQQLKKTKPSTITSKRGNEDRRRSVEGRGRFENRNYDSNENYRDKSRDSPGWFHEGSTERRDSIEDRRDRFLKRSTERKDSFRERSPDKRVNSRERRRRFQRRSPDRRDNFRGRSPDRREYYQRRSRWDRERFEDRNVDERDIRSGDFRDNFRNGDTDRRGVGDDRNRASGRNYSRNSNGKNYSRRGDDSESADFRESRFVGEDAEDNWRLDVGQKRSLDDDEEAYGEENFTKNGRFGKTHGSSRPSSRREEYHEHFPFTPASDESICDTDSVEASERHLGPHETVSNKRVEAQRIFEAPNDDFVFKVPMLPTKKLGARPKKGPRFAL